MLMMSRHGRLHVWETRARPHPPRVSFPCRGVSGTPSCNLGAAWAASSARVFRPWVAATRGILFQIAPGKELMAHGWGMGWYRSWPPGSGSHRAAQCRVRGRRAPSWRPPPRWDHWRGQVFLFPGPPGGWTSRWGESLRRRLCHLHFAISHVLSPEPPPRHLVPRQPACWPPPALQVSGACVWSPPRTSVNLGSGQGRS